MIYRYIGILYLKSILLFFIGISLFYTFFDFLFSSISFSSANIALLYVAYTFIATFKMALPLSLILGALQTLVRLSSAYELPALMSLGLSRKKILIVFYGVLSCLAFLYWILQATPLAYAYENASSLKKNSQIEQRNDELLIKYHNHFIYIKTLFQLTQSANDMRIFEFEEGKLRKITYASRAQYTSQGWVLSDVKRITLPRDVVLGEQGFQREMLPSLTTLESFRPKILDIVSQSRRYLNLWDAFETIKLFWGQNIAIDRVYASIYLSFMTPLYPIGLIMLLVAFVPLTPRLGNLKLFSALSVVGILGTWGIIFALQNMASSGMIFPFWGIVFPCIFLLGLGLWKIKKVH